MKRTTQDQEWYGRISYWDTNTELMDPADVENSIREGAVVLGSGHDHWMEVVFSASRDTSSFCNQQALCPTSVAQVKITGDELGISDDLISLVIASPDVPDLTLIDLPGITRVAVKGQPENIGEQVSSLRRG